MSHSSDSLHVLRNSLSDIVVIDIWELYEDMKSLPMQLSHYNKNELIRQAFGYIDQPKDVNILGKASIAAVNYTYINEDYDDSGRIALNEFFKKMILLIYFKCYEHKLFVGNNYPNIPTFPYYLENATEAGCILKLDTTYF